MSQFINAGLLFVVHFLQSQPVVDYILLYEMDTDEDLKKVCSIEPLVKI